MEYGSLFDLLRNETLHLSGEIILQVRIKGHSLRNCIIYSDAFSAAIF